MPELQTKIAYYMRELAHGLWGEILPLVQAHKAEVAHYQDIGLDVDQEAYNRAEEAGYLRCYVARVGGQLVGYCVVFLKHNLHYKASLQAVQDVLFLLPSYRKTTVARDLLLFVEDELRAEGVQVLYQHVKAARREGLLFHYLGYELIDHVWGKRLDREEG